MERASWATTATHLPLPEAGPREGMRLEQKVDHWGTSSPPTTPGSGCWSASPHYPSPESLHLLLSSFAGLSGEILTAARGVVVTLDPSDIPLQRPALRGLGHGPERGPNHLAGTDLPLPYRGDRPATRSLVLARWPPVLVGREEPRPGASDNPFDLRGRRHPGRITNSKDPDIAYLEARRRPARVEERIKEAKECGLTDFSDSSFQANRGRLLAVEMAQVLLAWAGRRWCPGEFLAAAPERSRYQLRHGAGRLVRSGRLTTLGLDAKSPWAPELAAACRHRRSPPLTSHL